MLLSNNSRLTKGISLRDRLNAMRSAISLLNQQQENVEGHEAAEPDSRFRDAADFIGSDFTASLLQDFSNTPPAENIESTRAEVGPSNEGTDDASEHVATRDIPKVSTS